MKTEPKIHAVVYRVGELEVKFEGEQWDNEILDTRVSIEGKTLCWITWRDVEPFMKSLNSIERFYI